MKRKIKSFLLTVLVMFMISIIYAIFFQKVEAKVLTNGKIKASTFERRN